MESKSEPSQKEKRLAICNKCDEAKHMRLGLIVCKKCGCLMNMKVALPKSKCPLNKW